MKIEGIKPVNASQIYVANKKNNEKSGNIVKGDAVEISQEAKRLSSLSSDSGVEESSKRVEEVKAQIAKGTYNISDEKLSEKIMDVIKRRGI